MYCNQFRKNLKFYITSYSVIIFPEFQLFTYLRYFINYSDGKFLLEFFYFGLCSRVRIFRKYQFPLFL